MKDIIEYYSNHSNTQTLKKFHIGKKKLFEILSLNNVKRHTKEENRKFTNYEKYGVENYVNIEKVKNTKYLRYGDYNYNNFKKAKETNFKKYGTDSFFKTEDFKLKKANTCVSKYGDKNYTNLEKQRKTVEAKYGVSNVSKLESVKNKISKSKIGHAVSEDTRKKISCSKTGTHLSEDKLKIKLTKEYITKKKNNSFNISKEEEDFYTKLLEENKHKTIYRQYKDSRYPFYCDFYIVEDDLFIECNFHWTHGGKPFNENDEQCKAQLNEWLEKSKTSKFYKQAIETWTIRDVQKQNIAKENNINYKVIY